MTRTFAYCFGLLALLVAACATPVPDAAPDLGGPPVARLDYRAPGLFLFVVPVGIEGAGVHPFVIDTGASTSVVFSDRLEALGLAPDGGEGVLIRGLTGIATKPTVSLPAISLGDHALAARRAVVLDREDASHDAAGILGMDVLADFVLRIDADAGKIGFYPVTEEAPRLPARFRRVPLSGGPPAQRNYGLLFASVRIAGREVPALVDTGSDFSAMNWHAALLHGDLRRIHNDLRRAWRVAGATGDFRPRTTVTVGRVPMGGWQWIDQRFLVLPLDGLSVLGADRLPLVIMGADMLSGRDVVLDPRRQQLFIAPAAGTSENIAREIGTP